MLKRSKLNFDISRSLEVKSNGAVQFRIQDFLLVSKNNHICLTVGRCSYLQKDRPSLIIGRKLGPSTPSLAPERLQFRIEITFSASQIGEGRLL